MLPAVGRPPSAAVAVVAALIAAQAAVFLLRPRDGVITPARVDTKSYFTAAQIERARAYRRPQLALYGGSLLVEGGLLVWLVVRPPRRLRGPFRRPLLASVAAGAALSLAIAGAQLPIAAISHQRAVDVGLSTQGWDEWAGDVARSWGIGLVFAGAGAGAAVALMCRFPRRWWIGGTGVIVAFAGFTLALGPVVIDPIFNRFDKLPPGQTRSDVLELARRAGVRVGSVFVVDASRRTTAANAYVTGLGATKRVVLYDTLLERFDRDQTRLVVAHELGHVHYRDVRGGLLYVLLVAPFGAFAAAELTRRLAPKGAAGPAVLPALALSVAALSLGVTTISNQLSRRIEARADSFSLALTGEPQAFISFERAITLQNISDPDPPAWATALLGTHPSTVQRIGLARAYERSRAP